MPRADALSWMPPRYALSWDGMDQQQAQPEDFDKWNMYRKQQLEEQRKQEKEARARLEAARIGAPQRDPYLDSTEANRARSLEDLAATRYEPTTWDEGASRIGLQFSENVPKGKKALFGRENVLGPSMPHYAQRQGYGADVSTTNKFYDDRLKAYKEAPVRIESESREKIAKMDADSRLNAAQMQIDAQQMAAQMNNDQENLRTFARLSDTVFGPNVSPEQRQQMLGYYRQVLGIPGQGGLQQEGQPYGLGSRPQEVEASKARHQAILDARKPPAGSGAFAPLGNAVQSVASYAARPFAGGVRQYMSAGPQAASAQDQVARQNYALPQYDPYFEPYNPRSYSLRWEDTP